MKTRKAISILLAALFILCTLQGCAGTTAPAATQTATTQEPAQTPAQPTETATATVAPSQPGQPQPFDEYPRAVVKDKLHIGVLQVNLTSESNQRMQNQIDIECTHRGWELTTVYYENQSAFRDCFLNLLNQGVDAIVITVTNAMDAKTDLFEQARNQGVGVYSVTSAMVKGVIAESAMADSVAAMELFYRIGSDHQWKLNVGVINNAPMFVAQARITPVRSVMDQVYINMHELAYEDISAAAANVGSMMGAQDAVNAWLQQYGDQMNCIFSYGDNSAMGAAEMISAWGDPHGEKIFTAGIDGGKQVWSYIRDNTPVQYSYAQPFELYVHNSFELIDQLQVKGMNPGDKDCLIRYSGDTIYAKGVIITRDNVPEVGTNIHQVFDYYNNEDSGAWYNWTDGPGIYKVLAYEKKN